MVSEVQVWDAMTGVRCGTYKAHKSVRVGLLLLASTASIWLALGAELLAHSSTVVVHLSCVMGLRCESRYEVTMFIGAELEKLVFGVCAECKQRLGSSAGVSSAKA